MSQCTSILSHLQRGNYLTVLSAIRLLNVYALSQRVGELKARGWPIEAKMIRLDSGKRVARYGLKKGAKCQTP